MGEQVELEESIHVETVEREIKSIIAKMENQINNQRSRIKRAQTRLDGIVKALSEMQEKSTEKK